MKLGFIEKAYLAFLVGSIHGRAQNILDNKKRDRTRICSEEDYKKVCDARMKSPVFHELLESGRTPEEIADIVRPLKGKEFEEFFGVEWPLWYTDEENELIQKTLRSSPVYKQMREAGWSPEDLKIFYKTPEEFETNFEVPWPLSRD